MRADCGVSPVRTATLGQGSLEVLVDVDGQRLERGYIDDLDALAECRTGLVRTIEGVDRYEEAGKGLPGSGGCGDEGVATCTYVGPAEGLRIRGPVDEMPGEPRRHSRVESFEWLHFGVSRRWPVC
jgi:hypothetical protein